MIYLAVLAGIFLASAWLEIVVRTREKYIEAYETLAEQPFPWK